MVSGSILENQQVDRLVTGQAILKEQSENGTLPLNWSKRLGLGDGADVVLSVLQHKIDSDELWPREVRSDGGRKDATSRGIKRRGRG
jgi:hypothetical protein